MKTVIEELRRQRDLTIIIVSLGLPLAVALGIVLGGAMMWLGLVLTTLVVIYRLRIKCPYCGHLVQIKQRDTRTWKGYTSPAIWDYCPKCHRDLTVPYEAERGEK